MKSILDEMILELKGLVVDFIDPRRPSPNLGYSLEDIVLSGFSVFFTQSPSFLSHQRQLERRHGSSNAQSLFKIDKIPTDNHIRDILDYTPPEVLYPALRSGFECLRNHKSFNNFKVLDDRILIALDGTQHHSSHKIHCPFCNYKEHKNGKVTYYHSFIGASLCAPGENHVLPLEPEFITPQDGHDKQDCEHMAAKRWLDQHGDYYATENAVILGDDLYSRQPVCEKILEKGLDFILVCKPDSHKVLYDFMDRAKMQSIKIKGQKGDITRVHFMNEVPLNGNKDAMLVNWIGVEVIDKTGKITYQNAFVTNLDVTDKNVADIAAAGRARWKIENETFNTLKTKGYNLEHNYGHGKQHLCNLLATMNLLAFSMHTQLDLMDEKYNEINEKLKCRKEFFEEIRTLTKYMLFASWDDLFNEILDSFKPRDSSMKNA